MASLTVKKAITFATLQPGQTHSWVWNNASPNGVYAFSAVPHANGGSAGSWVIAEVTKVRYQRRRIGGQEDRKVNFQVKNTGSQPLWYQVQLSFAAP
ncbi:MAG: hypothetical protein AAGN66_15385 [Acidobacteriota bacterium]